MRFRRLIPALLPCLVALCLLPLAAHAEEFRVSEKLQADMPKFQFTLLYEKTSRSQAVGEEKEISYDQESEYFYISTIFIIREDNATAVQRIDLNPYSETCDDETLGFVLEDMNFDGYLDMRVMQYMSAGVNIPYYCWLWDPYTQQFVYNEQLSLLSSPMFDAASQEVMAFELVNDSTYIDTTYRYQGTGLELFSRITTAYDFGSGTSITTFEQVVEGQMQVIDVRKEEFMQLSTPEPAYSVP